MDWPVGMGGTFKGVLDFASRTTCCSARATGSIGRRRARQAPTAWPCACPMMQLAELREQLPGRGGSPEFDLQSYRDGDLTPVYFGSAP